MGEGKEGKEGRRTKEGRRERATNMAKRNLLLGVMRAGVVALLAGGGRCRRRLTEVSLN